MLTVTKIFEFEAAHHLPDYQGKCHNLHGHTYKLEVEISGPPIGEKMPKGMIYDFGNLKHDVQMQILSVYDHICLNDIDQYPTAENILARIVAELRHGYENNLVRVRLWETSNSYAEWRK